MLPSIEFKNCDTFYKQSLELVSDYFHLWEGRKLLVLNERNEAIWVKRSPHLLSTIFKIVSYATIIIPLIVFTAQAIFKAAFKPEIKKFGQKDLSPEVKQALYENNSNKKVWELFGYKPEALLHYPKEVQFLKESSILFSIKTLESSNHPMHQRGIEYDTDDHPKIFSEGEFVRVDTLIERHQLKVDPKTKGLIDGEGNEWAFLYGHGLIRANWKFDKSLPSYELNEAELQKLQALYHGEYFIQLVTRELQPPSTHPLLNNFYMQVPAHASLRVIGKDGRVYSTSLQTERLREVSQSVIPQILTTIPAYIANVDYEEVRPFHKQYTTTFPITQKIFDEVIAELHDLSQSDMARFHFRRMNCGRFAQMIINRCGIEVSALTSLKEIIWRALPDLHRIPHVGSLLDKVRKLFANFVDAIPEPVCLPFNYLAEKIYLLFHTCLTLALGTNQKYKKLVEGYGEHLPDYLRPLFDFDGSVCLDNMFDLTQFEVYYTPLLTDWQKRHPNTVVYDYDKKHPRFCIVPGNQ